MIGVATDVNSSILFVVSHVASATTPRIPVNGQGRFRRMAKGSNVSVLKQIALPQVVALQGVLVWKSIAAQSAASFVHIWSKESITATISIGNGIATAMSNVVVIVVGSSVVKVLISLNSVMESMIGLGAIVAAMTVTVMGILIGVSSTIATVTVASSSTDIAMIVWK